MSKVPNNSYFIPRDLKKHPLWLSARPLWWLVMDWLLEHAAYKDEYPLDNHGDLILLKKGQVGFTFRQIAKELKISKNIIESAITHFCGFTTRNKKNLRCIDHANDLLCLLRQELRQQSRQSIRNEKSVYSILLDGYYEEQKELKQTRIQTTKQTTKQTTSRQRADTKKNDKKFKKEYKKDVVVFRDGGNVHNSLASSKHSPPSANSSFLPKEEQQQPSSSNADENETTFKLFSRISNFKLMDGQPLNDESIHRWASKRSTEELFQILDWFDAMQKSKFSKTGEVLTEAYLEQGITQGWWKVWASRQFAKLEDKKQTDRHRRNQ